MSPASDAGRDAKGWRPRAGEGGAHTVRAMGTGLLRRASGQKASSEQSRALTVVRSSQRQREDQGAPCLGLCGRCHERAAHVLVFQLDIAKERAGRARSAGQAEQLSPNQSTGSGAGAVQLGQRHESDSGTDSDELVRSLNAGKGSGTRRRDPAQA